MQNARDNSFDGDNFSQTIKFYERLRLEVYSHTKSMYPMFSYSKINYSDALDADRWRLVDNLPQCH